MVGPLPFHPAAARAVAALLLLPLALPHVAYGWSGADAYTIVLLNDFDTDLALQDQFYNAPVGAILSVARGGYRLMEEGVAQSTFAPTSATTKGASASARETAPMSVYALDNRLSTAMAYQGMKAVDAALPFRCRLSGEWVVWGKEQPRRKDADAEPILLHCRLPLPQNRTEIALQQRRYIARNRAAMSAALEAWWHTAASEQASRCLYGDGEKALTGTERYYELCPAGAVYRVQHERLKRLLQRPSQPRRTEGDATRRKGAPSVLDFLHTMHRSSSSRHAVLQNSRFDGIFEKIGEYHSLLSKPRWNTEYLVWESWYPSTNPCNTHYTTLSNFSGSGVRDTSITARVPGAPRAVRPQDAYWKTVVRFRCPSRRAAQETARTSLWTVTEVRQLCEYYVEVLSDLVCGWEQELDSFQVNPVPCVVVD
ncbi:hypothetical protein GH5_00592 [Leishmania sp. Ghana 2012 LV757]|uniref:hypothetical protein n=1 Tax=Leishmania sp. Ghana 2012 LV757 TaxID=2803181 RepID=UPI001B7A01E2|nr:hypothetical protein GH5_00592 [Leishmania sp. Ghana 2012 LV757]